jgi:hypothetical protein
MGAKIRRKSRPGNAHFIWPFIPVSQKKKIFGMCILVINARKMLAKAHLFGLSLAFYESG